MHSWPRPWLILATVRRPRLDTPNYWACETSSIQGRESWYFRIFQTQTQFSEGTLFHQESLFKSVILGLHPTMSCTQVETSLYGIVLKVQCLWVTEKYLQKITDKATWFRFPLDFVAVVFFTILEMPPCRERAFHGEVLQIPADRRETGAPKEVIPFHTFPLLGVKDYLERLFALAKLVIKRATFKKNFTNNLAKVVF